MSALFPSSSHSKFPNKKNYLHPQNSKRKISKLWRRKKDNFTENSKKHILKNAEEEKYLYVLTQHSEEILHSEKILASAHSL